MNFWEAWQAMKEGKKARPISSPIAYPVQFVVQQIKSGDSQELCLISSTGKLFLQLDVWTINADWEVVE